jgi:FKBP-type peptidyl-prolyl cis-trans isomerase FkpA
MSEATKVAIRPIQKGSLTRMWVGLAFAGLVAGGIAWAGMQRTAAFRGNAEQFLAWNEGNAGVETTKSGIQYQLLKAGDGAKPTAKDYVFLDAETVSRAGERRVIIEANGQQPPTQVSSMPVLSEVLPNMEKGSTYRIWVDTKKIDNQAPNDPKVDTLARIDVTLRQIISETEFQQQMMQQQMQQQQMQEMMKQQKGGR